MEGNGWNAYQKLVMNELADLKTEMAEARSEITMIRIELAMLKIKAGLWGAGFGLLPAVVTASVALLGGR